MLAAASWLGTKAWAGSATAPVAEPQTQTIRVAASDVGSRSVALGVASRSSIDFPRDIKDVLVADPKIANAVVRSSRRAYIIGIAVGQTNMFFFDADGKQIAGFDIAVTRDLNGIRAAIQAGAAGCRHPRSRASATASCCPALWRARPRRSRPTTSLRGCRRGAAGRQRHKVVNGIAVRGRDQVMLKVTVAEVDRDVIKQLGIDLSGTLGYGSAVVNFNNANPFSATANRSAAPHRRHL